jgi:hypothetical protein
VVGLAVSTRAGSSLHAFSLVVGLASTGVLAFLPGIAALSAVERRRNLGVPSALALIATGAGVAALVDFGAWSLSPLCAAGVTTLVPIAQWIIFGGVAVWLGSNWWGQTAHRDWQLIVTGIFAVGTIGVLAVVGTRSERHLVEIRESPFSRRLPKHRRRPKSSSNSL